MGNYGYYGKKEKKSSIRKRRRDFTAAFGKAKHDKGDPADIKKKKKSPGVVIKIIDLAILFVSIVCITLLFLALMAKYIDPNFMWLPSFPALVFPFLYIAHVTLTLYWIIRWRRVMIIVMGLFLLLGIPNMSLFMRPIFTKDYGDEKKSNSDIKLMSFNVMGFDAAVSGGKDEGTAGLIGAFIAENNVGIVCMQEFYDGLKNRSVIDSILGHLPYRHIVSYDINHDVKGFQGMAHAIYSKYPIIRNGVIDIDSTHVRSVWVDLRIKNDTIRIISNHLQNNNLSGDDRDFIMSSRVIRDSNSDNKIKNIVRKLRDNYRKRAPQAVLISQFRKDSPYRTVICGDFNDTPMSYSYHTIGKGMTDAFVAKGYGLSSTYHGFFDMFRIDYIFFSDGLTVKQFNNYDIKYSDHTPISAVFEIDQMYVRPKGKTETPGS